MIVHIFENIPHHYHNFMRFFVEYASHDSSGAVVSNNNSIMHKVYIPIDTNLETHNDNMAKMTLLDCEVCSYDGHKSLIKALKAEDPNRQFIFHSMLSRRLWLELMLTSLPARSHWVSWGGDLYQNIFVQATFKQQVAKWVQALTCRRFASVKSLNPGDGQLIKQILGRKKVDTLPYPLVGVEVPTRLTETAKSPCTLLLGNSAAPSNNHFELLAAVAHLKNKEIKVVMPLNYAGSQDYIATVIKQGEQLFGDKFEPLLNMLTKQEYDQLLLAVDVAVFAHDRQQGLYVAYHMMLHGKKLFLKQSTTSYSNFIQYGFYVQSLSELASYDYSQLLVIEPQQQRHNQQQMINTFTEQALGPQWFAFFSQLDGVVD
ncbi:TDP-N-acetylfucosamine:lipid II N-acetylfucosaminyltransferase [Shewanella morhuae]|uniref:4-alpha-L-fucosyltransferase n=1 Tax=Shewanella morhuae TaxID=365591 RepID=A0A380A6H8_9GAMM|nr:TDP-N-acetylfucosamine:lipid II N-acetylfucosaminyltransferase [Shewanella morhuae]SUI75370.1 4-alpha-L-fucosyltransferase [Shewanella morhuae]